jgi:hypothetical protein
MSDMFFRVFRTKTNCNLEILFPVLAGDVLCRCGALGRTAWSCAYHENVDFQKDPPGYWLIGFVLVFINSLNLSTGD